MLFVHAAPFGLRPGDAAFEAMAPADRRYCRTLTGDRDYVCLSRRGRAIFVRRGVFGIDALILLIPLRASARTVARLGDAVDFVLSPAMAALADARPRAGDTAPEDAWLEISRLQTMGVGIEMAETAGEGRARIYGMMDRLAMLPPICTRRLVFDMRGADLLESASFDEKLWGGIAFCLASFLCRSTEESPLFLSVVGTAGMPALLLRADVTQNLPFGGCRLSVLAERFPDAPELPLAVALAARHAITVEAYADGDGHLGFTCYAHRLDPALLGLKQPLGLSGGEAEAAEAEWCRLLPAFGKAEK